MKKLTFLLLITFFLKTGISAQEVIWHSWNKAYEIATTQKKPMLVFVQADWCHWCKRMVDKTFNKQEVSSLINEDFVAVKLDVEHTSVYEFKGEKFNGKDLLAKLTDHELKGIPSTIFISPTGATSLISGFIDVEKMKAALEKNKKRF